MPPCVFGGTVRCLSERNKDNDFVQTKYAEVPGLQNPKKAMGREDVVERECCAWEHPVLATAIASHIQKKNASRKPN